MGPPARFLYDQEMPKKTPAFFVKYFNLRNDELVPGGRYHNFHDFFGFPNPRTRELMFEPWPHVPAPSGMTAPSEIGADDASGNTVDALPGDRSDVMAAGWQKIHRWSNSSSAPRRTGKQ